MNFPEPRRFPERTKKASEIGIEEDLHVVVPCHEGPDGNGLPGPLVIRNSEAVRHIALLGSTGSGKTTVMKKLTKEYIFQNAHDPRKKPALIIFDFKADATVANVQEWAASVGRAGDVKVLSLDGVLAYDFFSGFGGLTKVQEYVDRLLFGCGSTNSHDKFWDEYRAGLLGAALSLSHLTGQPHEFPKWTQFATRWLLADTMPAEVRPLVRQLEEAITAMSPKRPDRALAEFALATINEWDGGLDAKTRSNVRATVSNALRPLLAPSVQTMFREGADGYVSVADAVERGHIIVLSLNSFLYPHLASLLAKVLKFDYYQAVFRRADDPTASRRVALLVMDEAHLSATVGGAGFDDAVALPLLRELNGAVMIATQSLAALDHAIGAANRRILMPNYNTIFFMRTSESETADWASRLCGTKIEEERFRERRHYEETAGLVHRSRRTVYTNVERPICTPAGLAKLEPGQAFLYRQFEPVPKNPIWIAGDL